MAKYPKKITDIRRLLRAIGYSLAGFRATWRSEASFRQEVLAFIIIAPLGLWLGRTGVERAILVGALIVVLIVELLNTAIETVVDRIGETHDELSGRAKDMGSAAVLVSLALAVFVWTAVLLPRYV